MAIESADATIAPSKILMLAPDLSVPLVLMAAVYLVFDKVWVVSTRPDGSGEPSFPSSHAMVVGTVFALTAIALPHYIKNRKLCVVLYAVMALMVGLVAAGRVLANKHYVVDVVAGLVFAGVFGGIYYYLVKTARRKQKLKELAK